MDKNFDIAKKVLENVGGKENVESVVHCVTRLRFKLKDKQLFNEDVVKAIPGVLGVIYSSGLHMVIIGNNVDKVYEHVCSLGGFSKQEGIDENLDEVPKEKQKISLKGISDKIIAYLAGSMVGILPVLVAASLCKTVGSLLGPDVFNIISDTSDLYLTFDFLYDVAFYFLPIFLGYTAAKTLKTEPLFGIYIGAMIIVPDFLAMVGVRDTFSIFGISVPVADYSQTFLPVILGVWIMSYIYKFLKRIIPKAVSFIFVPLITVLVMTAVMFIVCAPLGTYIGNILGVFFTYLSTSNIVVRIIGSTILGAIMPYMILFGMHMAVYMTAYVSAAALGYEAFVLPIGHVYSYVIYGMALGAFIKYKKKENKGLASSYFVSGFFGGISEPALYGVCLKNKVTMKVLCAACAVGGLVSGILHPGVYSFALANVFSAIASWAGGGVANIVKGLALLVISFGVGLVGTLLFADLGEE